ncbi:hypothetical protein V6Z11_A03G166600 [Gossypium hirsutum]
MSYRFGISKTFSDFSSVLPSLHSCSPFSSLHRSGFVLPLVVLFGLSWADFLHRLALESHFISFKPSFPKQAKSLTGCEK